MRPTNAVANATIVSLIMVFFFPPHESAQAQVVTGDLRLSVVDSVGESVPGIIVAVTGPNIQGVRGGYTNDLGLCIILALAPGKISVRLSHTLFQPAGGR
jgi:hypothetical protein